MQAHQRLIDLRESTNSAQEQLDRGVNRVFPDTEWEDDRGGFGHDHGPQSGLSKLATVASALNGACAVRVVRVDTITLGSGPTLGTAQRDTVDGAAVAISLFSKDPSQQPHLVPRQLVISESRSSAHSIGYHHWMVERSVRELVAG